MRIVLVSFEEPFFLPAFFNEILTAHGNKVVGCIIHPYRRNSFASLTEIARILSPQELAKLCIVYMYRKCVSFFWNHPPISVAETMRRHGIQTFLFTSLNSGDATTILHSLKPDIIVAQTSQFVPKSLLAIPRWGWINKHASLLPKYRGLYPIFWALYHNEPQIGVTLHKMTNVLDHGPMLAQEIIPIAHRSIFKLYEQVFQTGARLINTILSQPINFKKAPQLDARIYKTPTAECIREFRSKGYRFI